jgi:putative ABC transport system permease protein
MARSCRIVLRRHDDAAQRAAARSLERAFEKSGIELRGTQRMLDARQSILDHLVIITSILSFASMVVVVVGALGLASTLTLNVLQRTREIGVLGAIGATPRWVSGSIWLEGLVTGLLSFGVSLVLAAPISAVLEAACGRIFFKAPLDFHLSASAPLIWLALIVVLASLASLYPAWRATRLTVREALAYA